MAEERMVHLRSRNVARCGWSGGKEQKEDAVRHKMHLEKCRPDHVKHS